MSDDPKALVFQRVDIPKERLSAFHVHIDELAAQEQAALERAVERFLAKGVPPAIVVGRFGLLEVVASRTLKDAPCQDDGPEEPGVVSLAGRRDQKARAEALRALVELRRAAADVPTMERLDKIAHYLSTLEPE